MTVNVACMASSQQTKTLPDALTSYDFFKALAIVLMIIDHIGVYFYPEESWFRVFGRMCVPLWFFLIGYARSRDMGKSLWIGGGILIAANMLAGLYVLPLNILFSMLICRFLLDNVMRYALVNLNSLAAVSLMMTVLILPTSFFWEYGTQGILIAMFGYMVRHQKESRAIHKDVIELFLAANVLIFVMTQSLFYALNQQQMFVLAIGATFTFCMGWQFKRVTYPVLAKQLGVFTPVLKLFGRRTLEIYVIHLLLFKAIAIVLFPHEYQLFDWSLFSAF